MIAETVGLASAANRRVIKGDASTGLRDTSFVLSQK